MEPHRTPTFDLSESQPCFRRNYRLWGALVLAILILVTGFECTRRVLGASPAAAFAAADRFHARLNSGELDKIYDEADPLWRRSMSREDSNKRFDMIHRSFGHAVLSQPPKYGIHLDFPKGLLIGSTYRLDFVKEEGQGFVELHAEEKFLWHIVGDRAQLAGYGITPDPMFPNRKDRSGETR